MTRDRLRRIAQLATLASAAAILYFTLSPSPRGAGMAPDWIGHAALFVPLGASMAVWFATSEASRRSPRRTLAMVVLAAWIFAAATELTQGPIAGRDPALGDWLADMTGTLVGLFGVGVVGRLLAGR